MSKTENGFVKSLRWLALNFSGSVEQFCKTAKLYCEQSALEIERLTQENDALKAKLENDRWRDCYKEPPTESGYYRVWLMDNDGDSWECAVAFSYGEWQGLSKFDSPHWRPLPIPPEKNNP